MFKKIILITLLHGISLLASNNYKYEISPMIGYDFPEGNIGIKNYLSVSTKIEFNTLLQNGLKPELSFSYAKAKYDKTVFDGQRSSIYRFSTALVYELKKRRNYLPYVRAGIGYESWSKNVGSGNHDSIYGEAGAGVKLFLTKQWALRAEADYMLKNNLARYDSNVLLLFGVTYSFNEVKRKEQKPIPLDSDKDGVIDSKDECMQTPVGVEVDAQGCAIDKDADGVLNAVDKCPNTPKGVDVDENGCTIKMIAALIDGRKKNTAIVVATQAGSVVVDKPGEATVITDALAPPSQPKKLSKSEMEHIFGDAATAINQQEPKKFVLYFNGLQILPSSQTQLQQLLDLLIKRKGEYIEISGHTDTVRSKEFNYRYGLKRAKKVAEMIAKVNKDALKVVVKSYGELVPAIPTADNVQEDKNKRVEVFVY